MKYKCQVCGQIIDNNEMCPFCGSDSSQIIALDQQSKKGRYRCLVCGRETDNGEYCTYCGSQRLYNLDTQKTEDTRSIEIQEAQEDTIEDVIPSIDDVPTTQEEVDEKEVYPQHQEESLESKYFNMFGELLQLDSIKNPSPEVIDSLYRIGLNRGDKITPEEIANAFNDGEETDEEVPSTPHFVFSAQKLHNDEIEKEVESDMNIEDSNVFEEVQKDELLENNSYDKVANSLILLIDAYMHFSEKDKVIDSVLEDLKDELAENVEQRDLDSVKEEIIKSIEELIKLDKENGSENLASDEKYLKLIKILFCKE